MSDREKALEAALRELKHAVCGETGFAACVRLDTRKAYPWPALDAAEASADAALAMPATVDRASWTPTDAQTASACLSYRHDFGLLPAEERHRIMFTAREWLRAWQKEMRNLTPPEDAP
jgi:hypothetical protein